MRIAMTVLAALGVAVVTLPVAAQNSRSLQDMLMVAIRLGDVAAVRSILSSGADVVKRGPNGKTAIDVAVDLGQFEIAELLVGERRRQRDAASMVAMQAPDGAARAPKSFDGATAESNEVIQPSAEAAPEIVTPSGGASARAAAPSNITSVSAGPSVEQLFAVAQQLTLAAQALAAAQQSGAASRDVRGAGTPQTTPPTQHAFVPQPGRKPEYIEQASLPNSALAGERTGSPSVGIGTSPYTVVVHPRRRSSADEAQRVRSAPERNQESTPQVPEPVVARSAAPVRPASVEPAADDSDNELIRAVKGIGGFLGFGSDPKSEEGGPSLLTPREHPKRDRTYVPHVPARRASEYQSNAAEPSPQPQGGGADMPSVAAAPLTPVQTQPATPTPPTLSVRLARRDSGSLNPFNPESLPQGAVLPLTDPLAGNAPEVNRARDVNTNVVANILPSPRVAPVVTPQRPAPAVVPVVPPLPDATAPVEPTAVFERRAQQLEMAKVDPEPDGGGILKNLASAVGLGDSESEDADAGLDVPDTERLTSRRMPIVSLRPPLSGVELTLGNSVTTNQRPLPRGVAEPDPCIKRSGGSVMFCVVPVDWHPRVDPAFAITTYLYQGSRAIARYDHGKASHYHELFGTHQYDEVIKYFTARYGPPTDEWKRTISPFDRPRQPNPTMVWRARDPKTNKMTILEVRRYDDTRNVFPDMEHGAVRLYAAGAPRVFPVITGMDLMSIDWAARSDHTDAIEPALANTLRVGR